MYGDVQCNISIQCNPFPALGADRQTGLKVLPFRNFVGRRLQTATNHSFVVPVLISLTQSQYGNPFLTSEQYQFNAAAVLRVNEP